MPWWVLPAILLPAAGAAIKHFRDEDKKLKQKLEKYDQLNTIKSEALEVLGLHNGADLMQIKKAYRSKMKLLHPDIRGTQTEAVEAVVTAEMGRIQNAYDTLLELYADG